MLFGLDIYEFFTILYQKAALADTVIIFRANSIFLKAPTGFIFLAFECLTAFDTFFVQPYYNTSQIINNFDQVCTRLIIDLPAKIAPIDRPTFVRILSAIRPNCLFSNRVLDSKANADIVVKEPQKPTAANKAYFVSRFHCVNNTKNNPRIKLPMTLTIKTLT